MLKHMVDVSTPSTDKKPSPKLISLVNEWADSYIKSTELPLKILEAAEAEGLNKQQIRKIVEDVLVKRGLSERRIREVLPQELKDMSRVNIRKSNAAESAALPKQPEREPISPIEPEEDPKDLEIQFKDEKIAELEDALKKTEQFKPATQLQEAKISLTDPDHLLEKAVLTEETVFNWLGKRDNKIKCFYYGSCGTGFIKSNILANLENSGIKVFRRLYFEV